MKDRNEGLGRRWEILELSRGKKKTGIEAYQGAQASWNKGSTPSKW